MRFTVPYVLRGCPWMIARVVDPFTWPTSNLPGFSPLTSSLLSRHWAIRLSLSLSPCLWDVYPGPNPSLFHHPLPRYSGMCSLAAFQIEMNWMKICIRFLMMIHLVRVALSRTSSSRWQLKPQHCLYVPRKWQRDHGCTYLNTSSYDMSKFQLIIV